MILNSNFNSNKNFNFVPNRNGNIKNTINGLEKAQGILDQRLKNKQISNEDYIKKSNNIKHQIDKFKNNLNNF